MLIINFVGLKVNFLKLVDPSDCNHKIILEKNKKHGRSNFNKNRRRPNSHL